MHNCMDPNQQETDKRTRDHALESLRTYLSGRSEIEELDLLKLWKGLYYCMGSRIPKFQHGGYL